MSSIPELKPLKISLEDIKSATDNFSVDNFIGQGGFGRVYKGQLHSSATTGSPITTVAVKRLDVKHGQGQKEFLNEIVMLYSYKHDNLVTLVGFSDEGDEKIIVYKLEVRGSLDKYLASTDLMWVQRLQICLGAARGLDYLHNGVGEGQRVLHRDIKSSNILLDENWEAKVSDFGLSRIGHTNQEFSFLVTNACGTPGYADPLYVSTDILTKDSDVYFFGVVLFEVLCGRLAMIEKYNDERQFLSQLVKLRCKEGKLLEIVIPNLRKQMKPDSRETFVGIAYQCLNQDRKKRPAMGLIVEKLQCALEIQVGCRRITRILWGWNQGELPWSCQLGSSQKLRKITIDHKDWIFYIALTIEDFDGSLHSTPKYGGSGGLSGGQITEINFDAHEEIIAMRGTGGRISRGDHVITSLYFKTPKRWYGPFGKNTGTPFLAAWDNGSFVGFYGRAGCYVDCLGVYLKGTIE